MNLDEIGISLKKQPPSRDYGVRNSGTQLIIYGGKAGFEWDQKSVEDLNTAILKLNAPNLNIIKQESNKKNVTIHHPTPTGI